MAQIIKHRRGSLEAVSSATKRAGELLVVTGSAGITATNGNSILFVGIDGSTVTPANKILQGTTTPNLTGATYDTSIDGIPFYNTSTEKLYIVNKGGNVEVKATAQTDGTGIVSGSSQINLGSVSGNSTSNVTEGTNLYYTDARVKTKLNAETVVSGSSQIFIDSTNGYSTFSSSIATSISASVAAGTPTFANIAGKPAGLVSGSSQVVGILTDLNTFSGSQITKNATLASYTASVDTSFSTQATKNATLATYTASLDTKNATLASYTSSVDTLNTTQTSRLDQLSTFSGSVETKNATLATYTASLDTKNATLASYTASVDTLNTTQTSRLDQLSTFSGSQNTKNATLASYTASLVAAFTASGVNVTFNGDQTIKGNLYVQGTQTVVDSTTINLADNVIVLNAAGTSDGGLVVRDATGVSTVSGSLLWDVTNDYWKVGKLGSESQILTAGGMNAVSASSQIIYANISSIPAGIVSGSSQIFGGSGLVSSSAQITYASISSIPAGIVSGSAQVTPLLPTGVVSGSAQTIANLPTGTISGSSQVTYTNISSIPGGIVSGSSQIVSSLSGQNVSFGVISGSNLNVTGNVNIDGNLILGGTITIGDTTSDNLVVNADLSSSLIPNDDNAFDLGSTSKRYRAVYGTNINGAINANNGVVSGSSQITYANISSIPGGIVSGSSQTINYLNSAAPGVISGSSQLNSTTINLATLTNVTASGSFSGSFKGDGSLLTGIASTLAFSGSTGNDTLNLKTEALLVTGSNSISAAVTNNTITITADNATTSTKGVASFSSTNFDVTSGNVAIKANGVTAATLNSNVAGTGLSLNGGDNSLKVNYGSTSGTAVEGNTSLVVQGTTGQISVTGGSVTLGSGGTVTIGLPDNVTISGSLQARGDVTLGTSVSSSVTIKGNLYVQGTTTTVDSTTVQIGDNIIELNGTGAVNGGLLVRDVTGVSTTSGSLLWDTTNDYWKAGKLGSEKEVARFNATPTSGSVQVIGASGLFVNSQISDDAVKVTIGTDLIINGLTANSFVVSNSSKKLISVTPSNAGDLIQWNGSSFVASNELDGGTF